MYFVKYGQQYLHDPRIDGCMLLDLSLDCEENSCGFCDFTIYPSHPMYDKLRERDANNPIEVYDDNVLLFTGFIYELGKEFYLDGHVKCKGELDYLSESIVRPYSTLQKGYGTLAPATINGYFEWLIQQHNEQVDANKRFTIGINQGAYLDPNNYFLRESTEYPSTIEEITGKLIDPLGGYLVVRNEKGVRYIDYLAEWTKTNTQILDFGVNLTDYTQTDDALDVATFVIPLGAAMSETEYAYDDGYFRTADVVMNRDKEYYTLNEDGGYSQCADDLTAFESGVAYYEYNENNDESDLQLTVDGEPDGTYDETGYKKTGDVVYNESAVFKYGWIGFKTSHSDITIRRNLIRAGVLDLKERVSPKRTIEIKAVDMHLVNPSIKPIRIGEHVRVRSKPHNLDSYFLCVSIDLDLNNPESSLYTLGTTFDTLTGQQNKRINKLNSTINSQFESSEKISLQADQKSKEAAKIANEAKTIAVGSVASIHDEYALSNSTSDAPQNGWSTTMPSRTEGTFIWRRPVTTYGDDTTSIGAATPITGDRGEDATVLRIDSSRGTVFKNSEISTVLTAVIYRGSVRIENITSLRNAFGSSAYLQWSCQPMNSQTFSVISSSDSRLTNDGFNFTLTPQDIDTKVTFMCELKDGVGEVVEPVIVELDMSTATNVGGYINNSTHIFNVSSSGNKTFTIACDPSSTYVATMQSTSASGKFRFRGGSAETTTAGQTIDNVVNDIHDVNDDSTYDGEASITITTGALDHYLIVFYWTSTTGISADSWQTLYSTIHITKS